MCTNISRGSRRRPTRTSRQSSAAPAPGRFARAAGGPLVMYRLLDGYRSSSLCTPSMHNRRLDRSLSCGHTDSVIITPSLRMKANIEIDGGRSTFAVGLLADLIAALRRSRQGDLLAITSSEVSVGTDLETWCRFTGNSLVASSVEAGRTRWVIRGGPTPANPDAERPLGSRLWLYTNFDCNLRCDYCCVRSSPSAPRRALGLDHVQRIAGEAAPLRVFQ